MSEEEDPPCYKYNSTRTRATTTRACDVVVTDDPFTTNNSGTNDELIASKGSLLASSSTRFLPLLLLLLLLSVFLFLSVLGASSSLFRSDATYNQLYYATTTSPIHHHQQMRRELADTNATTTTNIFTSPSQQQEQHAAASSDSIPPSITELKSYVRLAYAAFCPDDTLSNWTCEWCLEPEFHLTAILYNDSTKTRGFVGYDASRNITIASFRGSFGSVNNWWLNLRLGTTRAFYNVRVRTGWYKAYAALQKQFLEALQDIQTKHCPSCASTLITTGHSLGAVIGVLAAMDAKLSFPVGVIDQVQTRNFGMPRIGHEDFVQLFDDTVDSSYRVVHYRDLVPHYPFPTFSYRHVGTELWIPQKEFPTNDTTTSSLMKVCDGSGEDPTCSGSIPIWHWDPDDHNDYMGIHNNECGQQTK